MCLTYHDCMTMTMYESRLEFPCETTCKSYVYIAWAKYNHIQQDGTPDDMVLVRVYGNSTDKFIDRDAEIRNMEVAFELISGLPAENQGNSNQA